MDSKIKKIKTCMIGSGDWGARVAGVINLISRYELIGSINTKTTDLEKNELLNNADMWYIATPSDQQFDYIKNGILSKKHIICESPVAKSIQERQEIYNLLLSNNTSDKIFYCNFPYFLDQDFARLMSGGLLRDAKFFSIKCYGPKFKNEPEKAKKFYINQAFNLIFNTSILLDISHFDRFVVKDDFFGEFYAKDITYLFEWGYSEYPKLDITVKGKEYSKSSEIIYDKYDQIMPILISFSDKIMNFDPFFKKYSSLLAKEDGQNLTSKLSLSSFLTACSAEYFSDIFCKLRGKPCNIEDGTKLFLNGGFQDQNYSIIENL